MQRPDQEFVLTDRETLHRPWELPGPQPQAHYRQAARRGVPPTRLSHRGQFVRQGTTRSRTRSPSVTEIWSGDVHFVTVGDRFAILSHGGRLWALPVDGYRVAGTSRTWWWRIHGRTGGLRSAQLSKSGIDVVNSASRSSTSWAGRSTASSRGLRGLPRSQAAGDSLLRAWRRRDRGGLPLHVGLVFDTSGSMDRGHGLARSAAIRFLNRLPRAEDMTVVDFDTEVRIATYGPDDFTRLVARLRGRKPEAGRRSSMRSASISAAQDQAGQKVLIVYTDGGDTSSVTYTDLLTREGLPTSRSTPSASSSISHAVPERSSACNCSRWPTSPAARRCFLESIKEVDKIYDRDRRRARDALPARLRLDRVWRNIGGP